MDKTVEQRLMDKIDRRGINECWPWTAKSQVKGYGRIKVAGKQQRAHRLVYAIHFGPIPDDLVVRHTCHNRACCNPNHLLLGTVGDNNRDTVESGRHRFGDGQKKLTADLARFIRTTDLSSTALGEQLGVHPTTISAIRNGRAWKNAA